MKENIIIYSNGCPKCRVLEAKLNDKNIVYGKSDNISEIADMGFNSLPVLSVGGEYLNFVKANDWVNEQ